MGELHNQVHDLVPFAEHLEPLISHSPQKRLPKLTLARALLEADVALNGSLSQQVLQSRAQVEWARTQGKRLADMELALAALCMCSSVDVFLARCVLVQLRLHDGLV